MCQSFHYRSALQFKLLIFLSCSDWFYFDSLHLEHLTLFSFKLKQEISFYFGRYLLIDNRDLYFHSVCSGTTSLQRWITEIPHVKTVLQPLVSLSLSAHSLFSRSDVSQVLENVHTWMFNLFLFFFVKISRERKAVKKLFAFGSL